VTPLARSYAEDPFWWNDADGLPGAEASVPGSADVVVVGAGYTGVVAAWELARRGKAVVVLEGEFLGFGASTRNGGMVLPGFKAGLERVERREGERGLALYRYSVDAVGLVERIISAEAINGPPVTWNWPTVHLTRPRSKRRRLSMPGSWEIAFAFWIATPWNRRSAPQPISVGCWWRLAVACNRPSTMPAWSERRGGPG
jgi:choline dehydrogenase-like flavoprotein